MDDPRFNEAHLESPRRAAYVHARDAACGAMGLATGNVERRFHALGLPLGFVPPPATCALQDMQSGMLYPLRVGLNTIGRHPDNDIVLAERVISRRHCAILVHLGNGCELHDTASKNGTYLNGHKLSGPTRLNSGDQIRMCDRQFTFLSRGETADFPPQFPTLSE